MDKEDQFSRTEVQKEKSLLPHRRTRGTPHSFLSATNQDLPRSLAPLAASSPEPLIHHVHTTHLILFSLKKYFVVSSQNLSQWITKKKKNRYKLQNNSYHPGYEFLSFEERHHKLFPIFWEKAHLQWLGAELSMVGPGVTVLACYLGNQTLMLREGLLPGSQFLPSSELMY